MDNLNDTVNYMNDNDWKKRFIAEYYQTKIRYIRLHNLIVNYEAGTLEFTPNCPLDLLKKQKAAMGKYLYILEVRARLENIELD